MILITKEEAAFLREKVPDAHIAIVNKHHRNKHRYVEESRSAMAALRKFRSRNKRGH